MIDAGVSEAEARRQFYAVDRDGLLVEGMPDIQRFQRPFVQPRDGRRRLEAARSRAASACSTWSPMPSRPR